MTANLRAELLVVGKRAGTWIVLGIWTVLTLVFAYAVPYATYLNDATAQPLAELLPQQLVPTLLGGFPFFGGVLALMLGVLAFGSEYGWGTLKTLFTQRPGRIRVFGVKLLALGLTLVPLVLAAFGLGALVSVGVALREGADAEWPSAWLLVRGLGASWLILAVWAAFGVLLAVLSRGTALAVGVGILYALVIEGLLSALATQVSAIDRLVELFLRANAYSLVAGLGVSPEDFADNGPGSFRGPFVDEWQALLVLTAYGVVLLTVAGWILRRRDVDSG
jgi:ABC-type transport system involved in multi-copper enzyme maturation permease subunit